MSNIDARRAAWLRETPALYKHADVTNAVLGYETVCKRTEGALNKAWAQQMRDDAWAAVEKASRNVQCVDDTGHHEPVAMSDPGEPDNGHIESQMRGAMGDDDADKNGQSIRQRPNPEASSRGTVGKSVYDMSVAERGRYFLEKLWSVPAFQKLAAASEQQHP